MKWTYFPFLKYGNFLDRGRHQILVIRRLTKFVVVRQFREKIKRLRLNRRNTDTKITCWMRSTSRRAKNSTTMSGICNHITNLAQECPHILKEIVHVAGNSARDCTDIAEYRQTRPPTSCNKNLGSRARSDCEARCSFGNVLSGEYPLNRLICRSQTSPPKITET